MAIQDFVNGSFRGKLGALVGQRWKDKNCIRTYAVPRNPKTKKQTAVRSKFATCIKISQLAMQMDFRAIAFQSDDRTVWNIRQSTALTNWKADEPPITYIPLLQNGQTAGINITPTFTISGRQITVSFSSDADVSGRNLSVLLYTPFGEHFDGEYYLYQSVIRKNGSEYEFDINLSPDVVNVFQSMMCATSFDETVLSQKILLKATHIIAPEQ